jgi:hypothetical protein
MTERDDWPTNEIILGPLANALYGVGRLESGPISAKDVIGIAFFLNQAAESLSLWGFAATGGAFRTLAEMIEAHVTQGASHFYGPEQVPMFAMMARQSLMHELEARVFFPVDSADAHYYREPRRDWESVTGRFPETIGDIEEAGRCYALKRYAACVFHCMQIAEHGLLALGEFMQLEDPKSGFTAVSNGLQRIKTRKYSDLTEFEQEHFAFFEQMNASVQAIKDAWRNKVNHAQGKLALMTTDFTPAVAIEIYMATRGFMRRLATELPNSPKQGWGPWRRSR